MQVGSPEYHEVVSRHPFLAAVIDVALPSQEGVVFEDYVEVELVDADAVMYPDSLVWCPDFGTPSPLERSGERRRVVACLVDATRLVRTLSLQEYDDAAAWETQTDQVKVGRTTIVVRHRMPAHVFLRSSYGTSSGSEKTLWYDRLSLAIVTVWMRPVGESAFVRSATIRFATHPEHGFQAYQRA